MQSRNRSVLYGMNRILGTTAFQTDRLQEWPPGWIGQETAPRTGLAAATDQSDLKETAGARTPRCRSACLDIHLQRHLPVHLRIHSAPRPVASMECHQYSASCTLPARKLML